MKRLLRAQSKGINLDGKIITDKCIKVYNEQYFIIKLLENDETCQKQLEKDNQLFIAPEL